MIKNIKRTIRVLNTASQEIDWATERKLPISLYLELEDHPLKRFDKTITEPKQKNITNEQFIESIKYNLGIVIQIKIEINKATWGEAKQVKVLACKGTKNCLVNSLKASKRG